MNHKRGMSLIELTIMIAVGSVLFSGISVGSKTLITKSIDARNMVIALNLAKRQMAIMNNTAYASLPAAPSAEASLGVDAAFPGFTPTRQVASVAVSGGNTINQITIRVRLGSATGPILIMLDTYRTNIVTFGNGT